jgi:murein DD-endopeptidase MepM/ murein hydrolase activator NlpD
MTVSLLSAPWVPAAGAQSADRLDQLDGQIQDAESDIDRLDEELEVSTAHLNELIAGLQTTQARLDALSDELTGAEAELEDRERILAVTTSQLGATAARLDASRVQLAAQRAVHERRVRSSYITANPERDLAALSARSAVDFTRASTYLAAIVSRDRAGVEEIDVLQTRIAADEADLATLQAQQHVEQQAAATERDRVAELVAAQQAVADELAAQADDKRRVLEALEADRSAAEQLIADLEDESSRIEQELAAAAAAAAAAEAAAQAAAEGTTPDPPDDAGQTSDGGPVSSPVGASAGTGPFIIPVVGRLTSEFGYRTHPISGATRLHAGMDIAAPAGTPIGAAGAGTVVSAGWRGGYGNAVIIDHGGGVATLYAHQSRLAASVGQTVTQGQVIGYVGTTGYSTGNHLHWEVRVNGTPINPRSKL